MDEIQTVDLRTVSFDIPPQEILTKDSVTVAVDAVVYYKVFDPIAAVTNVTDAAGSTRLLAQTTLRNQLGAFTLSGLLADRDSISKRILEILDGSTDAWGIMVERVEVKDVRLPRDMQRAMAAEAEATLSFLNFGFSCFFVRLFFFFKQFLFAKRKQKSSQRKAKWTLRCV